MSVFDAASAAFSFVQSHDLRLSHLLVRGPRTFAIGRFGLLPPIEALMPARFAQRAGTSNEGLVYRSGACRCLIERLRPWYKRRMSSAYKVSSSAEPELEGLEEVPLDRRSFVQELESLRRQHAQATENIGCYQSKDCRYCASCMFCKDCEACYRCNYCEKCKDCSNCNQCRGCSNCHGCSHCVDCEQCVGSAYLVLSRNCSDCTYCFGCVGLQKKDFHILNRPFDRSTYFKLVKQLQRELG